MPTYDYDTVEALVASYRDDWDYNARLDLRNYTAHTEIGLLRWSPGGKNSGWRLIVETLSTNGYWVEQNGTDYVTPDELQTHIIALMQKAAPDANAVVADALASIERLVTERDRLSNQIETETVRAVHSGAQKINAATAGGISRPTLDRWLENWER